MSSLLDRLAKLKAQSPTGQEPSSSQEVQVPTSVEQKEVEGKKEVEQKGKTSLAERIAATVGKVEAKATAQAEEEKKEEAAPLKGEEVKLIIENVSALEASYDMKELEGFNWQNFQDSLFQINNKMEESFPEINTALTTINKDLRAFPELAHLLSHEQIAVIVQRILIQKNLWIAPVKKAAAKKVANKKVDIAALVQKGVGADEL